MEVHQNISKWGNSLGLRIPATIAESLGIKQGDDVSISIVADAVVIKPVKPTPALSQLPVFDVEAACAAYDACDPIPDDMEAWLTAPPIGREIL